MAAFDKAVREIADHTFGAAVIARRHRKDKGADLRDTQAYAAALLMPDVASSVIF